MGTHLTTWGAMALQGPHHVAKQSSTIKLPCSPLAASNSALVWRLWTPILAAVDEKVRVVVVVVLLKRFCWSRVVMGDCLVIWMLVSRVLLNAVVADMSEVVKT